VVIRATLEDFRIEVKEEIQKTEQDLRLMIRGISADIQEVKEIVKGITHSVELISGKKSPIVKKAVDIEIGGIGDSLDLLTKIPQHLRRTFEVILKLDKKVTAKEVSHETGKSRPLESDYLNQLSDRGVISKLPKGKKVFFYYQKPSSDDQEDNGLKTEQMINRKKREIYNT
jgi:sugar-specific transcriptional regulator TrmB